jgi:biopolymer transport protein ExbB
VLTDLLLRFAFIGAEWVLWLLFALSFASIALIIERAIFFKNNKVNGDELAAQLTEQLRQGNRQGAFQLLNEIPAESIESAVVSAGLIEMPKGLESTHQAMQSAKARMRPKLEKNLSILATIGANTPFVGLLGTVLGIIHAARDLAATGAQSDPNAVMSGVFEALVATAVGLFVAIPAVVAFNIFQRRVRLTLSRVDSLAHLILTLMNPDSRPPVAKKVS